jgi:hypothetical protein
MISLSRVKEITIDSLKRILKVEQFGIKTAFESAPFGVDSSPLKDMIAVYGNTTSDSESVIIGYINENQVAEPGETRLFSLDSNGSLKSYLYLKKDGVIELNGDSNFAVKFNELQTVLNSLASNIDIENAKISAAITALGGSYIQAPITIDLTPAKNETIKTS